MTREKGQMTDDTVYSKAVGRMSTQDVHWIREHHGLVRYTEAEAEQCLAAHAGAIEDAMIERGWELLEEHIKEEKDQ